MAFKITMFLFMVFLSLKFQSSKAQAWIRAGYWYSGSEFPISNINSELFTHLICAFADVNSTSYELSISSSNEQMFSTFAYTVKQKNPSVTTLLSVRGGIADYLVLSEMVSNLSHRKSFIDSSIRIARLNGFQGLDLCWVSANTSSDMTNMGILFKEWRNAASSEPNNSGKAELILTAAVQYSPDVEDASFPVDSIQSYLDWIHVMAYDYHMPQWYNFTGAQAALFDPSSETNTDFGISSWIGRGISSSKLVLALPYYGYAWTLVNPKENGIGALARGPAISEDGSMAFKDIKGYIDRYNAQVIYNATYVLNYCSVGSTWIRFDDVEVVKVKVSYAKEKKLLGYFAWHIANDDNWELYIAGKKWLELGQ
ncbi:1,4-alpha-glucan-branching enzyme [Trema orientale]|uniref:1,4-alpha-glucan-branching enzyme n=1 Tax=Trema orientale TaxID=63057 RepID=A0A2P5E043_TREOI|nr:1,4-alpha-glucan-branching enzyme [Trema orientale]